MAREQTKKKETCKTKGTRRGADSKEIRAKKKYDRKKRVLQTIRYDYELKCKRFQLLLSPLCWPYVILLQIELSYELRICCVEFKITNTRSENKGRKNGKKDAYTQRRANRQKYQKLSKKSQWSGRSHTCGIQWFVSHKCDDERQRDYARTRQRLNDRKRAARHQQMK